MLPEVFPDAQILSESIRLHVNSQNFEIQILLIMFLLLFLH